MAFKPEDLDIDDAEVLGFLEEIAGDSYEVGMLFIFSALIMNKKQRPKLGFRETPAVEAYIEKWVNAYCKGKDNRPSLRTGRRSVTVPDGLIKEMYENCHPEITPEEVYRHVKAHSEMMTLEKLAGDMLEEYLCGELTDFGWHCCWGQTMKAIDFCHEDGRMLQVKNSDNSENSSSSDIRTGTAILKWSRRKSTKANVYYWEDLIELTGNGDLSEASFRGFVRSVQEANPRCVYKDPPALL